MSLLFGLTFFILGLVCGSFFNVVGLRVPRNEPFGNERSRCPSCQEQLTWKELIPVCSFVVQRGACRYCHQRISFIYPVMELITGLLFVFAYVQLGLGIELVIILLLISMSVILTVSDMVYMLLPNKILLFFLPLFIILRIVEPLDPWWTSLAGAIGGFLLVLFIIAISRGGMGAGDMKLLGVLGIVIGLSNVILTFFLASLLGTVIGYTLRIRQKLQKREPIPFGPYLLLAAIISYFYGDLMIGWYRALF